MLRESDELPSCAIVLRWRPYQPKFGMGPVHQESVSGRQNDIAGGYDTAVIRLVRRFVGGTIRGSLDAGADGLQSLNMKEIYS
ncbi:uncharacterized protein CLUP02_02586 [Colletotrichum lupini]|uniref:Uncharacterized protein n=1 Tax=Colletotrichum lupini TaxID=145971 RepID=A0A9Q8SGT2_9PEZI|nr:uncharacterized protein CLUP02_02586 [Colletotrichum lupini]UQC77119.1 hypothetical protein CLUP02_02586 [Colletotrichum lupini]